MQHWHPEKIVETRRDDFRRDIEQLNLVREAGNAYPSRQSWAKVQLHNLGHWMMATGERLHKRYQAPEPLPRWHQGSTLAR
jgi:hypothetical protein